MKTYAYETRKNNEYLYWSKIDCDWVDIENATTFTKTQVEGMNPPPGTIATRELVQEKHYKKAGDVLKEFPPGEAQIQELITELKTQGALGYDDQRAACVSILENQAG